MIWQVIWRTFQLDTSFQCPRKAVQSLLAVKALWKIALQFCKVLWKITMHDKNQWLLEQRLASLLIKHDLYLRGKSSCQLPREYHCQSVVFSRFAKDQWKWAGNQKLSLCKKGSSITLTLGVIMIIAILPSHFYWDSSKLSVLMMSDTMKQGWGGGSRL